MKRFVILLLPLLFLMTTPTQANVKILSSVPVDLFDDVMYDEAKAIYSSIRYMEPGEVIAVTDVEAWKEFEKAQMESHWDEIVSMICEIDLEIVDVYFNNELNRWLPITIDSNGTKIITGSTCGCSGMGCGYGCCKMEFNYNVLGGFWVCYCCPCQELCN